MTNYKQRGETLTVAAPYNVVSGAGVQVGSKLFGVAVNNQSTGDNMEIVVYGLFKLAKDVSTFASGDAVYWDNTNKVATSTVGTNLRIGTAVLLNPDGTSDPGGASGDATVTVRLTAAA